MNKIYGYLRENRVRLIVAAIIVLCSTMGLVDPSMAMAGLILETAPVDLKTIHEETKKALAKISDEVKASGEKAMHEAKQFGDMYAADKPKVDALLAKQGELMARLSDVEMKLDRRTGDGGPPAAQSIGEQVIASDAYKGLMERGGLKHARDGINFPVKAALSGLSTAGGGALVDADRQAGIAGLPHRRMTIRDLLTPGRTASSSIQYVRETGFTNNAAPVSETALKPQSTKTFDLVNQPVITIAHYLKASKQILDDAPIDPPGTETTIDVIRLMMLQATLALFPPTGIVLHPSDWALIELLKDTLGRYIIGNPQGTIAPTLWGLPVVATQAMTVDTALVGAFKLGAQIFDREDANVVVATENEDDFIRNMVTIRAEERLALAVYRPEAFIKNTNLP